MNQETPIGIARFTFEKMEKSEGTKWNDGIEIYHWESFYTKFLADNKFYGQDFLHEAISESDKGKVLSQVAENLIPGFYEVIGDVYYEFDPGYDSPNGPAEPDEWWWLENCRFAQLDEDQLKYWLPTEVKNGSK